MKLEILTTDKARELYPDLFVDDLSSNASAWWVADHGLEIMP